VEQILWLIGGIAIGQLLHSIVLTFKERGKCVECGAKLPKSPNAGVVEMLPHDLTQR
jgi:hypothetical protein